MGNNVKPIVYWILQDNQVTPFIVDFLELIRFRIREIVNLKFLIPDISDQLPKMAEKLNPVIFKTAAVVQEDSYEGYCRKRDLLGDRSFSEGLSFWRTLLLDDLGSGNIFQARLHAPADNNVVGIILQIPTPLGSAESEERIYYAWANLAKANNVPIFGYEMLPLSTRWTLAPSILDGIIATRDSSFMYLNSGSADLNKQIWLLPRYEARFFSPATTPFWRNGLGCAYQYQSQYKITLEKTILYIPHNVAMSYEYRELITHLYPLAENLHLMFSIGADQIRGSHSHQQIIETICQKELQHFSYSFHDLNKANEISMADAVVACSDCFTTEFSYLNLIPTIILDPMIPPHTTGYKTITNKSSELSKRVKMVINTHKQTTELSTILIGFLSK